jgi:hypothetical protein
MGLISHLGKEKADNLKKINQRTHDEILAGILGIEVSHSQLSQPSHGKWKKVLA